MSGMRGSKGATTVSAPGVTATLLLAANYRRAAAILFNSGGVTVYLGADNTVSTTNYIASVDASYSFTDDNSIDAWWGITASGTGQIRATEVA